MGTTLEFPWWASGLDFVKKSLNSLRFFLPRDKILKNSKNRMMFCKIVQFLSWDKIWENWETFFFTKSYPPASAPTKLRPSEHVHCTVWANWRSWICRATEFRPLRPEPSKAWTAFKGFIYIPIVWRPWVQEICQFPYTAFQFTKIGM